MSEVNLILVGVNHKTTPVEIREKLAFTKGKIEESVDRLFNFPEIIEHTILSTCNRVEIYARANCQDSGIDSIKRFICDFHGLSPVELEDHFYIYRNEEAVEHLFRVSSSLDSMVLGEAQILGQVKDAYSLAKDLRSTGLVLNQLFEKAFSIAKKVREETGIAERSVSISSAAVELAQKIFSDLENHTECWLELGKWPNLRRNT